MAETLITDQVCGACGSEVREQSMFCYHCGGALEAENGSNDSPSDAWFRGDITENKKVDTEQKETEKPAKKKDVQKEQEKEFDNKVEEIKSDKDTEETVEESSKVNVISAKPFKEKVKKKRRRRKTKLKAIDSEVEKEITTKENVAEVKVEEEVAKKELVKTKTDDYETSQPDNSKLKSASTLRKRAKPSRIKKVEIVWEERDSSPNMWFIVGALILSAIVAGLVFLAFYLK